MILALSLVVALSEAPRGITRQLARPNFFPLESEATWVYRRQGPGGTPQEFRVTARWWAEKKAFMLTSYFSPTSRPRWVRWLPSGEVWELNPFTDEAFLWYRFAVPEGTRWQLHLAPLPFMSIDTTPCVDGSWLTLAQRGEWVQVPAGTFPTTRITWKSPCGDAGIVAEWFAPGVGLVRREETSLIGPVVTELVSYQFQSRVNPVGWTTSLSLASPVVWHNRMPGPQPPSVGQLQGFLTVSNFSAEPVSLSFSGCVRVRLRVYDQQGQLLKEGEVEGEGCCLCTVVLTKELAPGVLMVPFTFEASDGEGRPLPPGHYLLEAEVDALEPQRLGARLPFEVREAY